MQAKAFIRIAVAAAALGMVGAAAGAATKPTLTVAISGDGSVTSHPAGIDCHPACKLHVRTGLKVTLTASPNNGAEFSHWSAPCGKSFTCTVKMTGSRVVHAFFKAQPAPPPPPPPPPPPAKPGNYAGTYTDGTFIKFEVGPSGLSLGNISYDLNGHCSNGGTSYGEDFAPGPFAIQPDGSFQGMYSYTFTTGNGTLNISGKFAQDGSASGTLNDSFTFTSGDSSGISCTTTGTWSAQVQS
jgi:hypothetical protein